MTPSTRSPVTRLTGALVRDKGLRPVIVRIEGTTIVLRAKGLRREETLDVSTCYYSAVKQRIAFEKAEKRKAKKTR